MIEKLPEAGTGLREAIKRGDTPAFFQDTVMTWDKINEIIEVVNKQDDFIAGGLREIGKLQEAVNRLEKGEPLCVECSQPRELHGNFSPHEFRLVSKLINQ